MTLAGNVHWSLIENIATFQIAVSKDAVANLQETSRAWNHPNLQRRKTRQGFYR